MGSTLATMLTMTTYGTWLRGDRRGWVDDGVIFPSDPELESTDRTRMKHPVYLFPRERLLDVGNAVGTSLVERLQVPIHALHVGTWHVHIVFGPVSHHIAEVAKGAKDAARYGLGPGRPIWTDGYDKRFCFDMKSAHNRIAYVERHNTAMKLPAAPYDFITPFPI